MVGKSSEVNLNLTQDYRTEEGPGAKKSNRYIAKTEKSEREPRAES